jgi:small subunit ribosomal protein S6
MYELTFLLENEQDQKDVTSIIEEYKGKIVEEEKWGERILAYPIKKRSSAFYFTNKVEFDPSVISDFKKKMNFNDKIIRYLLLKVS